MEITTKRLLLRPIEPTDVDSTYAFAGDLENTKYMMFLPYASREEAAAYIEKAVAEWRKAEPAFLEFAVVQEGAHIGSLTLYLNLGPGEAELGWLLSKAHWGHGYTGEAAAALIDYARAVHGVQRVIACCDSENTASRRVMEKLGMRFVSKTGGRRNRSSSEERFELLYEKRL